MKNSYQKGKYAFDSGLYCAESVLSVIAEEEGILSDIIPGIATGFCGGTSRTGNMCGAVTGGILALNIIFGRKSYDDSVETNYKAVQKLILKFKNEFGSVNCLELIDCNLGTDEGQKYFSDKQLHLICREFTGKAAEFTREIINNTKT